MTQTYTVENSLDALCSTMSGYYGLRLKYYGEATESLVQDSAANYVTLDGSQFCSVDDQHDLVIFLVRQNSNPNPQPGGGRKNILTRNVSFKLICNTDFQGVEFVISTMINATSHMEYNGSSFNSRSIAQEYFGLAERNYETNFFTVDFTITEKITCLPC